MKNTLQDQVAEFLKAPPPEGMIHLPNSFVEACLREFAEDGHIARQPDTEMLLRAAIRSYRTNARESDAEISRHFLQTADFLEEVCKQEFRRT